MAQRSGARMRRAATLRDARRHLAVYRPDAVLVDMGLPDGSGGGLIRDLVLAPSPLVVLGMSGDPGQRSVALAAGACGFIEKPLSGLAAFQSVLLRHLAGHGTAVWTADAVLEPDMLALTDDLVSAARMLDASPDAAQRRYIAGFLGGVARSAHDAPLEAAARSLCGADGDAVVALSGMVARRLGRAPGAFDQAAQPGGD
jgi:CheY-like chemotaxis protein